VDFFLVPFGLPVVKLFVFGTAPRSLVIACVSIIFVHVVEAVGIVVIVVVARHGNDLGMGI